ncbi:MAG: hypothetical protein AB7F96_20585 [Beijerinckiaceae bacterium]
MRAFIRNGVTAMAFASLLAVPALASPSSGQKHTGAPMASKSGAPIQLAQFGGGGQRGGARAGGGGRSFGGGRAATGGRAFGGGGRAFGGGGRAFTGGGRAFRGGAVTRAPRGGFGPRVGRGARVGRLPRAGVRTRVFRGHRGYRYRTPGARYFYNGWWYPTQWWLAAPAAYVGACTIAHRRAVNRYGFRTRAYVRYMLRRGCQPR